MGLFGNLAMELGNSEGDFCIMDPGLDKWAGVLGSSTVHWHSLKQYSNREMEFCKIEGNLGTWEKNFED